MSIFDNNLFTIPESNPLDLESPIEEHAFWACENIYSKPYPNGGIREEHGGQHVTRAALFTLMWANMRRRYGDVEALALTDNELKLIQIAVLFHDSGRENEGKDEWDNDSALNLYKYLTLTLGINVELAKQIAEATANKDFDPDKKNSVFYELDTSVTSSPIFKKSTQRPPRSIYQKLIHDADCLDILRARYNFDSTYLDFYKDFGADAFALTECLHIVSEARKLVFHQGDLMRHKNPEKKKVYNGNYNCYELHKADLKNASYLALEQLTAKGKLWPEEYLQNVLFNLKKPDYEIGKTLSVENIHALMTGDRQQYLLFRGIGAPSIKSKKAKSGSATAHEIKKILREKGNVARSTTLLPSEVYTRAGLLLHIEENSFSDIQDLSEKDSSSGSGKKPQCLAKTMKSEEAKAGLAELSKRSRLGNTDLLLDLGGLKLVHNEILITIRKKQVRGIAFNRDPSTFNKNLLKMDETPLHPDVGIIEAYFIQQVYYQETSINLPIFEISYYQNQIREIKNPESKIVEAWKNVCSEYIKKLVATGKYAELFATDVDSLKIQAIYGCEWGRGNAAEQSPDIVYEPSLRLQINDTIAQLRSQAISESQAKFIECITHFFDQSMNSEDYLEQCAKNLKIELRKLIKILLDLKISDASLESLRNTLLKSYTRECLNNKKSWFYAGQDNEIDASRPFLLKPKFLISKEDASNRQVVVCLLDFLDRSLLDKIILSDVQEYYLDVLSKNPSRQELEDLMRQCTHFLSFDQDLEHKPFSKMIGVLKPIIMRHILKLLENDKIGVSMLRFLTTLNDKILGADSEIKIPIQAKMITVMQSHAREIEGKNYLGIELGTLKDYIWLCDYFSLEEEKYHFIAEHFLARAFGWQANEVSTMKNFLKKAFDKDNNKFLQHISYHLIRKPGSNYPLILRELQKTVPNKKYTEAQRDVIQKNLNKYIEYNIHNFFSLDVIRLAQCYFIIGREKHIPALFLQKYFLSEIQYFQINLWGHHNPKAIEIIQKFREFGVNINDLIASVEQVVLAEHQKLQAAFLNLKEEINKNEALDDTSKVMLLGSLKQFEFDRKGALSDFEKCLWRLRLSNPVEDLLFSHLEILKSFPDKENALKEFSDIHRSISGEHATYLINSFYNSRQRVTPPLQIPLENKAPIGVNGTNKLIETHRNNLENLIRASVCMQSFFRARQAKKSVASIRSQLKPQPEA